MVDAVTLSVLDGHRKPLAFFLWENDLRGQMYPLAASRASILSSQLAVTVLSWPSPFAVDRRRLQLAVHRDRLR
jgi:hypothetical protein